jgi:hypothetical protein
VKKISMPTPITRKGSSSLWFRKKVPHRLRAIVGKTEVWESLKTADKHAAALACIKMSALLEADWARLVGAADARATAFRATGGFPDVPGPEAAGLTEIQPDDGDGPMADVPDPPLPAPLLTHQDTHALRGVAHVRLRDRAVVNPLTGFAASRIAARTDDELRDEARRILTDEGAEFTDGDVERFLPLLAAARSEVAGDARRAYRGNYLPNESLALLPKRLPAELDLVKSFEIYAVESGLKGGRYGPTAKRWRPKIRDFVRWLGHSDLSRMTTDDAYAWVNYLLSKVDADGRPKVPAHPKSVKDVWIASLSAVAGFMMEKRKLRAENPFKAIRVRERFDEEDERKAAEIAASTVTMQPRQKGYSHSEAVAILEATFLPASHLTAVETQAARRWLPWLCAYSGARVNELTSLYPADVSPDPVSGIWCVVIKPRLEKTQQWRTIPLHSHVIEQGFLDYVEQRRAAKLPLFYNPGRSRGAKAGNPQFKKVAERLAEWLHKEKLIPDGVQPSHAWRHLFKSTSRHVGMNPEVEGFITGHRPKDSNASSSYGDRWVATMSAEVEKYPRFAVDGAGVVARKKSRRSPDAIAADNADKAARKAAKATRAA